MNYIEEYYEWIKANPKKVCKKVKLVYEKLVDDIKNPKTVSFFNKLTDEEETHTYIFDEKKALRPIHFIERYCKQSKAKWAGKNIKLELWQKAFIEAAFGFIDKDTGFRKYNKVALYVARKNGKSTLVSGLSNYMLTKDHEGGAEIYALANTRDQAKIVWKESARMIKKSPALNKRIRCLVSEICYDATDSIFKPLASDSDNLDGLNAHFVAADEVHAWKDANLIDVTYDSMSARTQPMFLEVSTMGTVRQGAFDREYDYFSKLILNQLPVLDETTLAIIYELDDSKEWQDPESWIKANPGLGTIKDASKLRNKVNKAINDPNLVSNLLCKDFNVRQTDTQSWLTFDDLNNEKEYDDFRDCYCVGGCDLSSTTDLTCATLLGFKNNELMVKQMYFIPANSIQKKIDDDEIPYDKWIERDLVRTSGDSKIDYHDVTNWFVEQVEKFDLRPLWIGYDKWSASYWCEDMKNVGFDMVEVRQGAQTMSVPMKQMKADLMDKKINYNNNPVLKWCLSNTTIKQDENDNIRPVKKQSRQRIDGTVSLIDAYVVYTQKQQEYLNYIS